MKKKALAIMLGGVISLLPVLLILAAAGGAIGAVSELCSDIKDAIVTFFGGTEDGAYPVSIDNVTAEELLEMVSNKKIITDKQLKSWMVDRKTMIYILEATCEANAEEEGREYTLEAEIEYYMVPKATPTPTPTPEPTASPTVSLPAATTMPSATVALSPSAAPVVSTTPTIGPTVVPAEEREPIYAYQKSSVKQSMTVHTKEFEERYQVDWQLVYLFTLYHYMDSAKRGVVSVSKSQVYEIVDALKPNIIYYSNPAGRWMSGAYLTRDDVESLYPFYRTHYSNVYWNPLTERQKEKYDYVPGSATRTWKSPFVAVKEVRMFYYTDIYNNTMTHFVDNDTYVRTYSAQKFLELFDTYGGGKDLSVFFLALDGLPQGKRVSEPLKRLLRDAGIDY